MAGVLETIDLNEKCRSRTRESRWARLDLKESMKRFARGNRFPEERAVSHKSFARDSSFPGLKGGSYARPSFWEGGMSSFSRFGHAATKRKSIHMRFNEDEKKKKRKKFRLPNISIRATRKIGDDLNERTYTEWIKLFEYIFESEKTSYGNEKRREGKRN